MNILGVIPARGGSKGVPGKNIKKLGGKPLLAYTAEAANHSALLFQTLLSTDDDEIAEVGRGLGLQVPFIRPAELALDTTPTVPVLQHAVRFLEAQGLKIDAVCLLQVTSPFREPGLIDQAITKFIQSDADSLVTVLNVPHELNPHWTFEADSSGFLKISTGEEELITRRQNLPNAYYRDGSIYLVKKDVLLNGSLYGARMTYLLNDPKYYVNIDTIEDWNKAEKIVLNF